MLKTFLCSMSALLVIIVPQLDGLQLLMLFVVNTDVFRPKAVP
jgi:hypothetical protein